MSTNSLTVSCTNVDDLVKRYYLPVMYSAIFIVGVTGDIAALLVYVTKVRPWTNATIIMVNLLMTDLLLMVSMPILVYYYTLDDSWTLGTGMCRFTRFIFHLNLYGSILFLTCLAVFRYVAVVHPSHRENIKKKRWAVLACVLVWLVVVALITPIFNQFELDKTSNKTTCPDLASSEIEFVRRYSWVLTTLGYLCPLAVVSLCYWRIMRVLRTGPHTGSVKRTKARRVIVLILLCFIFCFLPFHVLRALRIYTKRNSDDCRLKHGAHAAYAISRPCAVLNVIFNLLLYTLSGDCFKHAFLELFRCQRFVAKTKKILQVAVISKPTPDVQ